MEDMLVSVVFVGIDSLAWSYTGIFALAFLGIKDLNAFRQYIL